MKKKTVLVTGAAGFLGSHLCRRLLDEGHRVIALDDFSTGRRDNLAPILSNQDIAVVEHDVVEAYDFAADEVYNLACPASPPHYQADPVKTMMVNVLGMRNALEIGRRYGARVFQASTSEVYGDPHVHPQPESYRGNVNTIGPRACYDEGKRAAETLCFDYHRMYGVEVRVVRIFNTYGPFMDVDDGRVVSNFITQALEGEPITIYGDGSQTRSFCYVDDMIEGFVRLMAAPGATVGPVNLGNPQERTVADLARLVVAMTGSSSPIVHKTLPTDDPTQRRPVIDLADALLGWRPLVDIETGLARTIRYFAETLARTRKAA